MNKKEQQKEPQERKRTEHPPNGVSAIIKSLIVTAIFGAVYFYVCLPAINPHSMDLYAFIVVLCLVYMVAHLILSGNKKQKEQDAIFEQDDNGVYRIKPSAFRGGRHKLRFKSVPGVIVLLTLAVALIGSAFSATIFHAAAYYNLLNVEQGDFAEDVAQISYSEIPMLDKDSAVQLGRRALGSISSNSKLVSQFEVSYDYSQINYANEPVRVAPLEYGDVIKWFKNRSDGIPGYIVVNMVTQDAELTQLEEGMKYSSCEHFGRNLYRHLRFQYPTYMFTDLNFEINEDGTPYWVCSRVSKTIGLFGGEDIVGAVLVNAVTGESTYYDDAEVPEWVDRVFNADLLVTQYNYHGSLLNGWLNSWLGQEGVTRTTDGYNYIAINDDVYMYTGVTSAGEDESNVGFILVNQRTKAAKYYNITGAEEYSAMSSAEGAVQHLQYAATFPILLNISDQPTYFMALKDSAELVKMYAMVNVSNYQITATGTTVAACQASYEQLLRENGITVQITVEDEAVADEVTVDGTLAEIRSAVLNGNTYYYFKLTGSELFYAVSAADCQQAVIMNVGDSVTISYSPGDGEILDAGSIRKA